MRQIYFGDFRQNVVEHIRELDKTQYEVDSVEWFLMRYLNRVVKSTEEENAIGKVEGSMRSLVRFLRGQY